MERRLSALLAADMVGYSRLMAGDEAGTLARLKAVREELIDPEIAAKGGRIFKLMGYGMLVVFDSVVSAVVCGAALQKAIAASEAKIPPTKRIAFRIGINLGDVILDGEDVFGDGVNIASPPGSRRCSLSRGAAVPTPRHFAGRTLSHWAGTAPPTPLPQTPSADLKSSQTTTGKNPESPSSSHQPPRLENPSLGRRHE